LLAAVGSILVAAGIVLLIAHNWDEFSRPVRSVIAFLPLLAAQALSVFVLLRRNESKAWRECAAIFNVAAIGSAISLVSQTYQIHGSLANFIFVWILLSLPLVYLMRTTLGVWGSVGSELIIDTDSPQQQRWSMRRHERSVLRKTFRTVDSKLRPLFFLILLPVSQPALPREKRGKRLHGENCAESFVILEAQ
jgi:hypothetical protein